MREEVVGGWKRLHKEELHNLYTSPNIIRVVKSRPMRWIGQVAHMGEMRNTYKILVRKTEWKRSCRRPKYRENYYIRMALREIGWDGIDWINLAQNRAQLWALVNTVINIWVPQKVGIFLTS
jgi:hypothetical protein